MTPGVTRGHSATVNAFSTTGAPAAQAFPRALEPGDPPNPSGPFPNVFNRQQQPERFTSDGPRRVFFKADGTPYTPGNTTSTGGVVLTTRLLQQSGATPRPLVRAGEATVAPAGDGDPYLEPGESGVLTLPVTHVGDGLATSVSARLSSTDPLVTITPASRGYRAIAAGATTSRTFTIALAADYPVGKPVLVTAKVAFVGILSPMTRTISLQTGHPAASPTAYSYIGPPVAVPDRDEAGASVTIPVAGSEYASAITFWVDGTTCSTDIGSTTVGIDHTWVGDLTGTLTSCSGLTATVFGRNGVSGNNLFQVVFDDSAADSFTTVSSGDAPFTGTWRPVSPLSSLLAQPAIGDWTFKVVDGGAGDTGSIRAVTLNLTGYVQ